MNLNICMMSQCSARKTLHEFLPTPVLNTVDSSGNEHRRSWTPQDGILYRGHEKALQTMILGWFLFVSIIRRVRWMWASTQSSLLLKVVALRYLASLRWKCNNFWDMLPFLEICRGTQMCNLWFAVICIDRCWNLQLPWRSVELQSSCLTFLKTVYWKMYNPMPCDSKFASSTTYIP